MIAGKFEKKILQQYIFVLAKIYCDKTVFTNFL